MGDSATRTAIGRRPTWSGVAGVAGGRPWAVVGEVWQQKEGERGSGDLDAEEELCTTKMKGCSAVIGTVVLLTGGEARLLPQLVLWMMLAAW